MNMKKTIAATVCAGMVVVGSVAGTMAYFTDTTDAVTNTFTVGNVNIDLGESSTASTDGTVKAGTEVRNEETNAFIGYKYHLMPGSTYSKNVDVTVDKDSEPCYLFVEVTNGFASYEETDADSNNIAAQMTANDWIALPGVANVYYKEDAVTPNKTTNTVVDVFETFTVEDSKTAEELAAAGNVNITVKAYAIQAEGFDSAEEAWVGASSELTRN